MNCVLKQKDDLDYDLQVTKTRRLYIEFTCKRKHGTEEYASRWAATGKIRVSKNEIRRISISWALRGNLHMYSYVYLNSVDGILKEIRGN